MLCRQGDFATLRCKTACNFLERLTAIDLLPITLLAKRSQLNGKTCWRAELSETKQTEK